MRDCSEFMKCKNAQFNSFIEFVDAVAHNQQVIDPHLGQSKKKNHFTSFQPFDHFNTLSFQCFFGKEKVTHSGHC